jgi:glycine/D-amino acid oxidase-like deaminating enzyme
MPHIDTLVVGQGLAGSALAWHLLGAGERVLVIDDDHKSASSMVAAGLINPLAGMRFNRRPEMDDWLDAADRWYSKLETRFGQHFHHALPMLRLFRSPQQRRFHERRLHDPASGGLLGTAFEAPDCPEPIMATYGGFIQQRTGYVDMPALLTRLAGWLRQSGHLLNCALPSAGIRLTAAGVEANGMHARRVVFCDGYRLAANPWFDWLPLTPDKGEILDLRLSGWQPGHIINGAHWLVPCADRAVRFGATHEHRQIDTATSSGARSELLAGLHAMMPLAAQHATLLGQRAGVRPATRDRYPLLGQHPKHPALWVFNGFGARGALTIPWYARRMSEHLCQGAALPAEADIRRFA